MITSSILWASLDNYRFFNIEKKITVLQPIPFYIKKTQTPRVSKRHFFTGFNYSSRRTATDITYSVKLTHKPPIRGDPMKLVPGLLRWTFIFPDTQTAQLRVERERDRDRD